MKDVETRRNFLKRGAQLASTIAVYPLLNVWADSCPTPASTAGPYYKPGAPFKSFLREQSSNGIPLNVFGKVIDASGRPLKDAIIEIWHTNPDGNYDLEGYKYRASIRVNSSRRIQLRYVFAWRIWRSRPAHPLSNHCITKSKANHPTLFQFRSDV